LENAAQGCEGVLEACVIGVKHKKWDERPLLFIVAQNGALNSGLVDKESVFKFLADKVAKWWMPDDIIFIDQLPHTATGKLQKRTLRDQYWNYLVDAEKS
jgi:fatty-acyl-CoA synthase